MTGPGAALLSGIVPAGGAFASRARISLHSPVHPAQMYTPGPATSRSPGPRGLPQNEHAPAATLPRLRRRCLPG